MHLSFSKYNVNRQQPISLFQLLWWCLNTSIRNKLRNKDMGVWFKTIFYYYITKLWAAVWRTYWSRQDLRLSRKNSNKIVSCCRMYVPRILGVGLISNPDWRVRRTCNSLARTKKVTAKETWTYKIDAFPLAAFASWKLGLWPNVNNTIRHKWRIMYMKMKKTLTLWLDQVT